MNTALNQENEEDQIHGRANHLCIEASRRWRAGTTICRKMGLSEATFYNKEKSIPG
jgi:hypothetical protein